MKRQILLASALGLALQLGTVGRAIAVEGPSGGDGTEGHRHFGEHGDRADAVVERLKLTPDQKKVFEAAFKERREKMKALQDEFMEKRKAVIDASDSKITAVLNGDQKAEFAKMKAEAEKRREDFKANRKDHDDDRPEHTDQK
jgi:Spy/CpxP family protein refolding chaperone